ncbi:MAG: TonB-dependent receptor [Chitinophagaceae bacterium]
MKRIALIVVILFSSSMVFAQEDTVELLPVEVKALRANATAPFTKTNISKTEILKLNTGQDLPFFLNQTPSVVVNSDAGNGVGYTGIRIRGSDATRVNVTLNGIPFNDAESGGTFFVDMPDFASSVNSIQIQRGVGTSSNGPGAFGATINISTHEINNTRYLELNNSIGSFNTIKNTLKAGSGLLNNRFTIDARLSQITSNGYIDRASSDLKSYYFSGAYLNNKSSIRFTTFAGKEKTYQAWNGVSEEDLKTNRTINYAGMEKEGEPYDNESDNYTQRHYQVFFDHKLSLKLVFNTALFYVKGKGYYEQYKAGAFYADYNLMNAIRNGDTIFTSDLVRQLWLDNDFYGNIFSLQYKNTKTEATLGGAVTQYKGKHFGEVVWAQEGLTGDTRWYDNDATKNDFNVYAKWHQSISTGFKLYTDLQLRAISYQINGFRNNPSLFVNNKYIFFNPKIGISYSKNNMLLYGSYSVANKEPNRDDFEAAEYQQPQREQLHDIEVGLERKTNKYRYGITGFFMKYKDQLVLTGKINDVGAYTRTNIDNSYRTGVELEGSATITDRFRVNGNLSLSRNRIKNFIEYIDDYDNNTQNMNIYKEPNISFSPNIIGVANVATFPIKNLEVSLLSKYVGKQYLDNTRNEQRKLNSFLTQDIRAIFSFSKKWFRNVQVIAQLNNIFNVLYEPNGYTFSYYYNNQLTTENYYFPMAGRNWIVGLNVKL